MILIILMILMVLILNDYLFDLIDISYLFKFLDAKLDPDYSDDSNWHFLLMILMILTLNNYIMILLTFLFVQIFLLLKKFFTWSRNFFIQ